jgi:predicted RNA-binding Zn-ribbon protein involved in translation (DUF1610 family)
MSGPVIKLGRYAVIPSEDWPLLLVSPLFAFYGLGSLLTGLFAHPVSLKLAGIGAFGSLVTAMALFMLHRTAWLPKCPRCGAVTTRVPLGSKSKHLFRCDACGQTVFRGVVAERSGNEGLGADVLRESKRGRG